MSAKQRKSRTSKITNIMSAKVQIAISADNKTMPLCLRIGNPRGWHPLRSTSGLYGSQQNASFDHLVSANE